MRNLILSVIGTVLLGLVVSPCSAQCGDCEQEIYQWPLYKHRCPDNEEGYNHCEQYPCHDEWLQGSCVGYHPGGCGVASLLSAKLTDSEKTSEEGLRAILLRPEITVAKANSGNGLFVMGCGGSRAVAFIPLEEGKLRKLLADRGE